jgi:hypothetical protein
LAYNWVTGGKYEGNDVISIDFDPSHIKVNLVATTECTLDVPREMGIENVDSTDLGIGM